jgi:hypothetical protein
MWEWASHVESRRIWEWASHVGMAIACGNGRRMWEWPSHMESRRVWEWASLGPLRTPPMPLRPCYHPPSSPPHLSTSPPLTPAQCSLSPSPPLTWRSLSLTSHHLHRSRPRGEYPPGTVIVFDEYVMTSRWQHDEFAAFQEAVTTYGWQYEYLGVRRSPHAAMHTRPVPDASDRAPTACACVGLGCVSVCGAADQPRQRPSRCAHHCGVVVPGWERKTIHRVKILLPLHTTPHQTRYIYDKRTRPRPWRRISQTCVGMRDAGVSRTTKADADGDAARHAVLKI